jgi:hypothetical protein
MTKAQSELIKQRALNRIADSPGADVGPRGAKFSIALPGELLEELDKHVREVNVKLDEAHPELDLEVSRNQVVVKAIRKYLEAQGVGK